VSREPRPFIVVWRIAVCEHPRLDSYDAAIAHAIGTYMTSGGWTGPDPTRSPSRAAIAAGAHCRTRSVDNHLPHLETAGPLELVRGRREQHVYVASIEDELAKHLLVKRRARDIDFASYERINDRAYVGPGANDVLHPGRTLFTPLVNVTPNEGEPGSPEVERYPDEDLELRYEATAETVRRSLDQAAEYEARQERRTA